MKILYRWTKPDAYEPKPLIDISMFDVPGYNEISLSVWDTTAASATVELTPDEAREIAAGLVKAADTADRAATPVQHVTDTP